MSELFNLLFNPVSNGIMTVLTGISLLYWIIMSFAGDGLHLFDGDVDMDGHLDSTADVTDVDNSHDLHHHSDTDTHIEPSFFAKAMDFINVGKVPIMIIVTLFKFIGWIITIISSIFLNTATWGLKSILILIPIFFITFIFMHFFTKPLVKLFKNIGYHGEKPIDFLGRMGKMKATIEGKKLGSAEFLIERDPIRLYVESLNGEKIEYGDEVIIVDESKDKKIYYVTKEITIHNI